MRHQLSNRRFLSFCGFISIFLLCFLVPRLNAEESALAPDDSEVTISMDLQDANLKDVLKILSIQSGLNFIASEGVQERKITLYLDKVPLKETMNKLFKANNLSYDLDKESNVFIVKDWGKPRIETITKVFMLKHASVSTSSMKEEMNNSLSAQASSSGGGGLTGAASGGAGGGGGGSSGGTGKWKSEEDAGLTRIVKKLLSEIGSVIEDFRTNSLVVTDIPSNMEIISQTIASLDIPAPQVLLEVEMLDVTKATTEKLGIKYGQSPLTLNALVQGASWGSKFPLGSLFGNREKGFEGGKFALNTGTAVGGVTPAVSTYQIVIDFLKDQTDTKYLARPRILTLNNETAEIKITTQESVGVKTSTEASTGTTSAEPERVETGVSLRVTPQINSNTGEITMFVHPQVSEASAGNTLTSNSNSFRYRDPEIRSTKSVVRIKDGETIIIGGLLRRKKIETITKLPFLGDLPLVGALFRHKNIEEDKERELLVFITPHIIKDSSNIELAQAKKVNLPEREQNVFTGIDREKAINNQLNYLDKKR